MMKPVCLFFLFLTSFTSISQSKLQESFIQISDTINGKLGVSALHIESGKFYSFNGDEKFPMQSVYKFPIAFVMLREVDKGKFNLADTIYVKTEEYIPKSGHSPIRDKYPVGIKLSLKEILRYNVELSDGTACDVLIRLLGGTKQVQQKLQEISKLDINIATTEMTQVKYDTVQYQNWSTPLAMNKLLALFQKGQVLSKTSEELLRTYMNISDPWFDRRIKRFLPPEAEVIHKTGSSRTYDGLTSATNDVGIITLPDGNHLAISVFLSDSYDSQETREMVIGKAALVAYKYWVEE